MVESTDWILRITVTTVGLPYFRTRVKKIVPTADPANLEKSRKTQIDLWDLLETHHQERQEHEQDEQMFPQDDRLRVEEIVQRDAPGALGPPKRRAERHELVSPGIVRRRLASS